jgi:hypothetical protein
MDEHQTAIYADVITACEAILAAIEGVQVPVSQTALLICLAVVAHDEEREKNEVESFVITNLDKNWSAFTRENVETAIGLLAKRRTH